MSLPPQSTWSNPDNGRLPQEVKITNELGQVVYQMSVDFGLENNLEVDVSHLTSGTFYVLLELDSEQYHFRFLKL